MSTKETDSRELLKIFEERSGMNKTDFQKTTLDTGCGAGWKQQD